MPTLVACSRLVLSCSLVSSAEIGGGRLAASWTPVEVALIVVVLLLHPSVRRLNRRRTLVGTWPVCLVLPCACATKSLILRPSFSVLVTILTLP